MIDSTTLTARSGWSPSLPRITQAKGAEKKSSPQVKQIEHDHHRKWRKTQGGEKISICRELDAAHAPYHVYQQEQRQDQCHTHDNAQDGDEFDRIKGCGFHFVSCLCQKRYCGMEVIIIYSNANELNSTGRYAVINLISFLSCVRIFRRLQYFISPQYGRVNFRWRPCDHEES